MPANDHIMMLLLLTEGLSWVNIRLLLLLLLL